jgi:hypothetical protein
MGRVVEAYDTQLGRTVALKEVLESGGDPIVQRFKREVQITARLEHASIVPLYDSGTTADGRPYYVMRRVTGRPLDQLIGRSVALSDRLALLPNVLAAIDAVAHAHRRGVIHRDLKPANILVGELGETVVIDWGLAKVLGEEDPAADDAAPSAGDSLRTQAGSVFGTPGFMPPEQARGESPDERGDVYALGATLYQLLSGQPPVAGNSATELLESTQRAAIRPLAELCPGAPAELVAIVEKALEKEPVARYRDAAALGEDVRRFLTGQLVAAHRYTVGERLSRFTRRHRGSIAIALLALAAVTLLGAWSIRRIVVERDAATAARQEAEERRRAAELALADAHAKGDELKLTSARQLAQTDPTKAIALLKTLRADSPKLGAAAAIAKHAIVRGAAWGLPALTGLTVWFEMSPDGAFVAQLTREGDLLVLDVRARSVALRQHFEEPRHATWLAGGKLLVQTAGHAPELVDVRTGASEPLAIPETERCRANAAGDAVVCAHATGIGLFDPATREWREIWAGKSEDVEIAADGRWLAFMQHVDAKREALVVLGRDGHELLRREGSVRLLALSGGGQLAVLGADGVDVVRPLDVHPAYVRAPIEPAEFRTLRWLQFSGETLAVFAGPNLWMWGGRGNMRKTGLHSIPTWGREAGRGALVAATSDDRLGVVTDVMELELAMPSVPASMVRIAARPGVPVFAVTGKDVTLLWNLDTIVPRELEGGNSFAFLDEHVALVEQPAPAWDWVDVDSGERSQLVLPRMGTLFRHQSDGTRLLLQVMTGSPDGLTAGIARPGKPWAALPDIPDGLGALLEGGAVVFVGQHGELLGKQGDAPVHEMARLPGEVVMVGGAGYLGFVAADARGNFVRGRFGGPIEHTHVDVGKTEAFAALDPARVMLVSDSRLYAWTSDVHVALNAPAGTTIVSVSELPAGMVVMLSSSEGYFIPKTALALPVHIPLGATTNVVPTRNNQLIGMGVHSKIDVIDVTSTSLWSFPSLLCGTRLFWVSPGGTRIAQSCGKDFAIWTVPQQTGDLASWLDEVTNATMDENGVLTWPWQGAPVSSSVP